MIDNDFHKDTTMCVHVCFCRFKLLGILDDSELIDGDFRGHWQDANRRDG